ncbi:extracellular calcium-sensing receptor-like [Protopterus annectens]|uniref:extracellular calcium-sensing receptor-like n=1 Tax=Protopterus annectens TaxID=7888 RepID=UPI001CF9F19B|nr:extracellular calcium-sensing receptor-like [Protopterus annectens]
MALSDKNEFPSFLRTVPSDFFQSVNLARLVLHFRWTWVGILTDSSDYGQQGSQKVKEELIKAGACIAFHERIPTLYSEEKIQYISKTIKTSSSNVIMTYGIDYNLYPVMEVNAKNNVTGKIWIASDAWSNSPIFHRKELLITLQGTLGIQTRRGFMSGFKEFIQSLTPFTEPDNVFLKIFWELIFDCKFQFSEINEISRNQINETKKCTGYEKLKDSDLNFFELDDLRYTYNIYNTIYAIAHAFHNMNACKHGQGPFCNATCTAIGTFKPWQLFYYLKTVHFWNKNGEEIFFDMYGDPPAVFGILNWQATANGYFQYLEVGRFNSSATDGEGLTIDLKSVVWNTGSKELFYYLKTVHFWNKNGEEIFFDMYGDPPAVFGILNWQATANGYFQYLEVGRFNSSATDGEGLTIDLKSVVWNTGSKEIPRSVCSESCPVGYRKVPQPGQPICCFNCVMCSRGEISNQTDSVSCVKCTPDEWPNDKLDKCVKKQYEYLSYEQPLGNILSAFPIFMAVTTAFVFATFMRSHNTPVVKANNRELSYILLISLVLCFLCSLIFIGRPTHLTCMLRQVTFGIIFTLSVSCILAKTVVVIIAFKASKPNSNLKKYVGPRLPKALVTICTLIQVIICANWLIMCPPFQNENTTSVTGKIIVECNEGSPTAFWCMVSYMGLLATVSLVVAFLSRNLPDSFNEAKYITFSMLVFVSVWLSFIPAYLSTLGKYMVAVEMFAIVSSGAGLLFCIFTPKCFIILFRPNLNTRDYLMGKGGFKN